MSGALAGERQRVEGLRPHEDDPVEAPVAFATFKKLVRGLTRTREGIATSLRSAFASHAVDEAALDDLETSLLAADLGPALTEEVLGGVRKRAREGTLDGVRRKR